MSNSPLGNSASPSNTRGLLRVIGINKAAPRKYNLPQGIRIEGNRYRPQICENGKSRGLGSFETQEEAEMVHLKARIERDERYIADAQKTVDGLKLRLESLRPEVKKAS
jgi:hypothetical protein